MEEASGDLMISIHQNSFPEEKYFEIKKSDFKGIVSEVVFCCATDESRPILKGALLIAKDGKLEASALDGFRMANSSCEIIGGSEREADYDTLVARIKEQGLDPQNYDWYLDLRRYGSVPHAGFGMGIERMVRWVCGLQHVRETIPFPRMMDKIRP